MKPPVETFDSAADFLRAQKAASKGTRARKAKGTKGKTTTTTAALAGAHSEPGMGDMLNALTRLAAFGLMPRYREGYGFDFWDPRTTGRTTTAHATYHAAVAAAESEASECP